MGRQAQRMGAEGFLAGGRTAVHADGRVEPLNLILDQRDQGHRSVEQMRRQPDRAFDRR
jgi:hypothetical protein